MFDARAVLKLYRPKDAVEAIMRWRGLSEEDAAAAVKRAGGKLD